MRKIIGIFIILFVLASQKAFSIEATHLIYPGATFITTVTGRSCSTFAVTRDSVNCNPALFTHFKSSGVQFSLIGKAEGNSIETGKKLILEPITETQLRQLFQKNSFNSFSFNSNISFFNPLFKLTYSPYLILGDISIFNPAFPEISLNLIKRSILTFSSGGDYSWIFGNKNVEFSMGQNINFYNQSHSNAQFTLYDLATNAPEKLIVFKKSKGFTLDFGTELVLKNFYSIKISNQLKNIFSKEKIDPTYASSSTRLQNLYLFEPYSQLGIGKEFTTRAGRFEFNIENYFSEFYQSYDLTQTALGVNYSIGLFSFLGSFSKNYQSTGMHFLSENFDVGIAYVQEKNIGSYQSTPEKSVFLGVDVNL